MWVLSGASNITGLPDGGESWAERNLVLLVVLGSVLVLLLLLAACIVYMRYCCCGAKSKSKTFSAGTEPSSKMQLLVRSLYLCARCTRCMSFLDLVSRVNHSSWVEHGEYFCS
jgi:hypothetical protein